MLRKLLRPRLWWLLVLPLIFHLTRKGYVGFGDNKGVLLPLHSAEYITRDKSDTSVAILHYQFMGIDMEQPAYDVVNFAMYACLVIGCVSVGKELFFNKRTDTHVALNHPAPLVVAAIPWPSI